MVVLLSEALQLASPSVEESVALKEANETDYWIDLLAASGYFHPDSGKSLQADCRQLLRILIAIIKTTKSRR